MVKSAICNPSAFPPQMPRISWSSCLYMVIMSTPISWTWNLVTESSRIQPPSPGSSLKVPIFWSSARKLDDSTSTSTIVAIASLIASSVLMTLSVIPVWTITRSIAIICVRVHPQSSMKSNSSKIIPIYNWLSKVLSVLTVSATPISSAPLSRLPMSLNSNSKTGLSSDPGTPFP